MCSFEGCNLKHYGLGLCKKHYMEDYKNKHREHLNLLNNNYYHSLKGQQSSKNWRKTNKEKISKYQKNLPLEKKMFWRKKHKEFNPEIFKYREAVKSMKKRNLPMELSIGEFSEILHLPCNYCGSKHKIGSVDRIDSLKGYIKSNVQPLCTRCNLMKLTDMPEDFISHIRKIYKHLEKKGI